MADLSELFGNNPQPDFNGLYDALKKAQSPYSTLPAHGWLQNNHPAIAGALDNAFLTMGSMPNTPNVSGAGDNIAAVAQGLMGAAHARHQKAIEQAMLPIQVAQQGMTYQKGLWDILKDRSEVGMYDAHSKYYGQLGDYRDYLQNDKPNFAPGGPKFDDNGEPWAMNLRTQQMEYMGDNPDVANNPNYRATFLKGGRPGATRGGGLNLLGLAQTGSGGDPSTQDGANAILDLYSRVQAGIAGRKTGATDVAHQPEEDSKNFLGVQKQYITDQVGKPPTSADQKDLDAKQQLLSVLGKDSFEKFYGKGSSNFQYKNFQDRQSDYESKAKQARDLLGQYIKSGAHRKGIGIQDWMKQNQGAAQAAPAAAPQTAPNLGGSLDQIFGPAPSRP